jgi:exonuclease V
MKQGSEVHRILEEQDHDMVQVQVKTREDMWGLKIWNVIQGLKGLRATGTTRELEIWGVIDGQVINGIIDEISYTCPDPALEEALENSKGEAAEKIKLTLPTDQASITLLEDDVSIELDSGAPLDNPNPQRKAYITDVKTRSRMHLPQGASLRGTLMQLMLYRLLLESLVTNAVPSDVIFARYDLKPLKPFSSTFIAEIAALDFNFQDDTPSSCSASSNSTQTSIHELESYKNLSALWNAMIDEFTRAISDSSALSDVLRAEFRFSKTGEIFGNKIFAYDAEKLREYLVDEMSWWKGERQARGVDIEEAFKCRMCEFSEECTWRKEKTEEAIMKHRLRATAGARSAV